jgi:TRAP-type C4-dicarboxylate transport system permease small subunit
MKSEKLINIGIPILCGVLILLIILFSFLQIVLRQFFNFSLNWTDEVSQFCMMWIALFGSIWLTKNDQHLNTGLKLHQKLNKKQIRMIDSILALVIVGIAGVAAYQTAIFSLATMDNGSLSLNWIKMGYIFVALPLAMIANCYYYLKRFFKTIRS